MGTKKVKTLDKPYYVVMMAIGECEDYREIPYGIFSIQHEAEILVKEANEVFRKYEEIMNKASNTVEHYTEHKELLVHEIQAGLLKK